ncbi:glycosyltransferase family 4 protein [Vibrio scophthalmi]|uniref:glycosyltransferase family 4 protein n=1 Tax=Vibrio scophthalmi TaxID=45658 RepID=UPI0038731E09
MKKILFVVNVDWAFISHRLPIALEAIKQGFEVHIACAISERKEFLEGHGLIVHPINISRSGVNPFKELGCVRELFQIIRLVKPDVTHAVTIKPVLYANIIARILKVPKRVSAISGLGYVFIAEGYRSEIFRFFISFLYKIALTNSNSIIFQNEDDARVLRLLRVVNKDQEVLIRGSGVDLDKFRVTKEPDGTPVVMLLARLLFDKGVLEFVEAARILNKDKVAIRMVLVGEVDFGNPKSVTPEQLTSWVKEGVVEHWGYRKDVAKTISESTIMVLPSYREGLPKSLIEAAACGRAVITTDVPGCRDAIEPNVTGILVPVKSPQDLAQAILFLVKKETLRKELASEGRRLAESAFDVNAVVNRHIEIYRK